MAGTPPDKEKNKSGPEELVLPAYVLLRPEGVYINLSPPPAQDILQLFIDRLFTSETRFVGLDYAMFTRLLYGEEPMGASKKEVKIATKIVRFPPERMELYKGVKIDNAGKHAEYMFEPTFIEKVTDEPVYGDPDENGTAPVVDHIRNVEREEAELDFDEFVAIMWLKGVRYGIDEKTVRTALKTGETGRKTIASHKPPSDSKDAEVVEESDTLRQDNAPLILPNGKADLRRARNRFPQVAKDTDLLRKVPRALGKPGYAVTGTVIEPRAPKDLDMNKLAGEGTRIEQTKIGEMLVAAMDGFIVIEEGTGRISVTDKIENKGGINAKSTGDIMLGVDEFTEHGEVQEGRVVEGKHMTFISNVFGSLIAKDGNILLKSNLSGGRAQSVGGNVTIKGRAINAVVEAWDGEVDTEFAEGCLIMGKKVRVGRAINCEIIAEELQLEACEGCGIAGKGIQVSSSDMRKHRETVVTVLLPDIAAYNREIAEAQSNLNKLRTAIDAKNREIAASQSDAGFSRYLAMAEKVRSGLIKFTPEQQAGWQKIVNQFAPLMRGTETYVKKCEEFESMIRQMEEERDNCDATEYCKIENVRGETVAKKQLSNLGLAFFREQPEAELRINLHQLGTAEDRIFSSDHGSLDWHFTPPGAPETPA